MERFSVRYIVDDVDVAAAFYADVLGFEVAMRPGPGFAMLDRGPLRLLLNSPGAGGGAGQTLSDGSTPEPGGWNRFQLGVEDLDAAISDIQDAGAELRGDVIEGRGGRQVLVVDPSGNLVELFEAHASWIAHQPPPCPTRSWSSRGDGTDPVESVLYTSAISAEIERARREDAV